MPKTTQTGRRSRNLRLIALRINAGLSRDQLAHRVGVGRETIRLVESGFVPTVRVQFALASAFDLLPLDIWPIESQPATRSAPRKPRTKVAA